MHSSLSVGRLNWAAVAQVWGRDDDGGGLPFKQQDIDKILRKKADHHGPFAAFFPLEKDGFQSVLSLCVSDINKQLLLNYDGCIPLLIDCLLLDLEHPRRSQPDFEAVAPHVQRVSCHPHFPPLLGLSLLRLNGVSCMTLPRRSRSSPCSRRAVRRCCRARLRPRRCSRLPQMAGQRRRACTPRVR